MSDLASAARQTLDFSLPKNRFDALPLPEVVKAIGQRIAEPPPHMIYTQHRRRLVVDNNVFVAVIGTLEQTHQAMRMYESELRSLPHPGSPQAVTAPARRCGSAAGVPAAEAFELVRSTLLPEERAA